MTLHEDISAEYTSFMWDYQIHLEYQWYRIHPPYSRLLDAIDGQRKILSNPSKNLTLALAPLFVQSLFAVHLWIRSQFWSAFRVSKRFLRFILPHLQASQFLTIKWHCWNPKKTVERSCSKPMAFQGFIGFQGSKKSMDISKQRQAEKDPSGSD